MLSATALTIRGLGVLMSSRARRTAAMIGSGNDNHTRVAAALPVLPRDCTFHLAHGFNLAGVSACYDDRRRRSEGANSTPAQTGGSES